MSRQKNRLVRKKKEIKLESEDNNLNAQQEMDQIKSVYASTHLKANYKYTE